MTNNSKTLKSNQRWKQNVAMTVFILAVGLLLLVPVIDINCNAQCDMSRVLIANAVELTPHTHAGSLNKRIEKQRVCVVRNSHWKARAVRPARSRRHSRAKHPAAVVR